MAYRGVVLATGQTYHVFNRSVQDIPIFKGAKNASLFLEATEYYLQVKPPVRFSFYRRAKEKYPIDLQRKIVNLFTYCVMPTHFHFLVRQEEEKGIRKFIQRLTNSYAHYFSIKYKNRGPVFEGNFKAVRVENDEQLIHLSRYIHLNPVTAYLAEQSEDYPFSSYHDYLRGKNTAMLDVDLVLSFFKSPKDYQKFVLAQKDYQRELDRIKDLLLE